MLYTSALTSAELAMAVLDDLPTSVISEIVERLNPRLYIDFVRYLPPEVCLKIFEYLDPVSLVNVAHTCKAWNTLASDPKLWQRLYYIEGWKVILPEITAAERIMNQLTTDQLETESQAGNFRSSRDSGSFASGDEDLHMNDTARLEDTSMDFSDSNDVDMMRSMSSKGKAVDWRSGANSDNITLAAHLPNTELPSSSSSISPLWCWDVSSRQFRMSWKCLYSLRRRLEMNWEFGRYTNYQLPLPEYPEEGHTECIYSIQYTPDYLVSGSRDKTLRIWNMHTRRLARKPLIGHTASVLCLQFDTSPDEDLIVSGGSDSQLILWKFSTGEILQRITDAHRDPVLNLRFDKRILVSCSKDKTIKIFNRLPLGPEDEGYPPERVNPVPIHLRSYDYESPLSSTLPILPPYSMIGKLEGHNAAVNAVQICGNQIVSASGDRAIKGQLVLAFAQFPAMEKALRVFSTTGAVLLVVAVITRSRSSIVPLVWRWLVCAPIRTLYALYRLALGT
jgi:F-box and WD-40 domain protein 1/11